MRSHFGCLAVISWTIGWAILCPAQASRCHGRNNKSSSAAAGAIRVREARRPPALWKTEVEGDYKTSTEAARADALSKAALELFGHLREQFPSLRYQPTPQFLVQHQMVDNPPFEEAVVEQVQDAPTMYRQKVTVELRREHLRPIFEEDRRLRSRERMEWAARVFGGILIGLAALVGYIRLDDWTKGYSSTILIVSIVMITAVGFLLMITAVGFLLWWNWF